MHIRFQSNLIQEEFRQESQNIDNAATKEFKCIPQYNNLLMYSNKIKGISFASKHNIQENQKQFKEQFTLDPSMIKLQKTSKNAIMSIPTQAIKYGHFVIPDTLLHKILSLCKKHLKQKYFIIIFEANKTL